MVLLVAQLIRTSRLRQTPDLSGVRPTQLSSLEGDLLNGLPWMQAVQGPKLTSGLSMIALLAVSLTIHSLASCNGCWTRVSGGLVTRCNLLVETCCCCCCCCCIVIENTVFLVTNCP